MKGRLKRLKGIVVNYDNTPNNTFKGVVRVQNEHYELWNNTEFPIVSVHQDMIFVPGIHVDFILTRMERKGNATNVAVDVRPICPSPSVKKVDKKNLSQDKSEHSFLWSIIEGVDREFRGQTSKSQQKQSLPGKGGPKHRYLQQFIKQLAEEMGYRAIIEKQTPTGRLIDVSIEGPQVSIACEIPISTVYSELENIKKCLEAGYDYVISVATERKVLNTVKRGVSHKLDAEELKRVYFFLPEELSTFLKQLETPKPTESIIKGYRVRVNYKLVDGRKTEEIRRILTEAFVSSLQRKQAST